MRIPRMPWEHSPPFPSVGPEGKKGEPGDPATISYVDARKYIGLTPTGATDVLAKLQEAANHAAIEAAEKEQGAILLLPPWQMQLSAALELDNFVTLWGQFGATKLRLGNGSNTAVIKSKRFEGGGANGGTEKVGIFFLEVDGNFAGNPGTVEPAVNLDGIRTRMGWVDIKNGVTNLNTIMSREWSPGTEKLEDGYFVGIGLKDPQKENAILAGPHDTFYAHFLGRSNVAEFPNIRMSGTAPQVFNSHAYGNAKYAWQLDSGELVNCIGEGGREAQVCLRGDSKTVRGGRFFSAGGADGKIGIKFGDATAPTAFSSVVEGVKVENCTNGAFDYTHANASGSRVTGWVNGANGSVVKGNPSSTVWFDVIIRGGMDFPAAGTTSMLEQASAAEMEFGSSNRALGKPLVIKVTGAVEITKIKNVPAAGTQVILLFSSTAKVTNGNNLKLNGNFEGVANRTLSLVSDGTNLVETGRKP